MREYHEPYAIQTRQIAFLGNCLYGNDSESTAKRSNAERRTQKTILEDQIRSARGFCCLCRTIPRLLAAIHEIIINAAERLILGTQVTLDYVAILVKQPLETPNSKQSRKVEISGGTTIIEK